MSIRENVAKLNENIFDEEMNFTKPKKLKNTIMNNKYKFINLLGIIINIIFIINLYILNLKAKLNISKIKDLLKDNKLKNNIKEIKCPKTNYRALYNKILKKEALLPNLKGFINRRTFERRLPLSKKIKCKPHIKDIELIGFLSLLTKQTTYFETGSGCSSIIAKYYAKKTYAVEGCKKYYDLGIKNGLKDNIIFRDLKPDNPTWSNPGKNSNLEDWKKYFQSYKKEYNADVILIDGRFKVATAMDIFNKIRNDTIVLLHEYNLRPQYYIIEDYYQYIYHWGTLFAFVKKKDIKEIPLEIQKKYLNIFLLYLRKLINKNLRFIIFI